MKKQTETPNGGTSIEVESAVLQTALRVPGIGTETSLNKAKIPDLKMELRPYGLHCWGKGKEWVVPSANVISMVLAR